MDAEATLPPPPYGAEAAALEAEQARLTIDVGGYTLHYRTPVAMGALAVLAARLDDRKNELGQLTAIIKFLKAWMIPEDHDAVESVVEQVIDMEVWLETEFARIVEVAVARPT
jgi:hypothetical protein